MKTHGVRHGLKSDTGGKPGVWGPQGGQGAGPFGCSPNGDVLAVVIMC